MSLAIHTETLPLGVREQLTTVEIYGIQNALILTARDMGWKEAGHLLHSQEPTFYTSSHKGGYLFAIHVNSDRLDRRPGIIVTTTNKGRELFLHLEVVDEEKNEYTKDDLPKTIALVKESLTHEEIRQLVSS